MQNEKQVSIPLVSHFKLSKEVCPKTQEEMAYMSKVPYALAVGSLMYEIVCTRPNIAHAVRVVSKYMNNPGKEHWMVVKWIIRRSTTRYVFIVGGTDVSWVSKLQSVVALSTIEEKYVVATEASKEMIWLQRFLDELGKKQELGRLYNDSQSAIHLAKNSAFHSNTKHIELKHHFIRLVWEDGQLKLEKIHTSENPADMLTKL
eukprot:PITA_23986